MFLHNAYYIINPSNKISTVRIILKHETYFSGYTTLMREKKEQYYCYLRITFLRNLEITDISIKMKNKVAINLTEVY